MKSQKLVTEIAYPLEIKRERYSRKLCFKTIFVVGYILRMVQNAIDIEENGVFVYAVVFVVFLE